MSKALDDVAAERRRQIEELGYTPESDLERQSEGQLRQAAACYAAKDDFVYARSDMDATIGGIPSRLSSYTELWPWEEECDKRKSHSNRRRLVIAAALLIAEIDRLDNLVEKG